MSDLKILNEYKKKIIQEIESVIESTTGKNEYCLGMRNGMRYCLAIIDCEAAKIEQSEKVA